MSPVHSNRSFGYCDRSAAVSLPVVLRSSGTMASGRSPVASSPTITKVPASDGLKIESRASRYEMVFVTPGALSTSRMTCRSSESPVDVPSAGAPVTTRMAKRANGERKRVRRISWTYADWLPSTRALTSKFCSTRAAAGARSNVTTIHTPITHQRRRTTSAASRRVASGARGGSKLFGVEGVGPLVVSLRCPESAAPVRFTDQRPNPPVVVARSAGDGFSHQRVHDAARAMCRVHANRSNDRCQLPRPFQQRPVLLERKLGGVETRSAGGLCDERRVLRIDQNEPDDVSLRASNEKARPCTEASRDTFRIAAHERDERLRRKREILRENRVRELLELENVGAPRLRVQRLELVSGRDQTIANGFFRLDANRASFSNLAKVTSDDVVSGAVE